MTEFAGPSFGPGVLVPATCLLALLLIAAAMRIRSLPGRFLIAALWARYMCGAYHAYMFRPVAAGLSGNALVTMGFVAAGLAVIRPRHLMLRALLPIYLLIGLCLLSGGLNGDPVGAFGVVFKYAYLALILVATFEALRQDEGERLMPLLLWAFAPLLLFQWLSVALHLPKGSETGDGLVWIGGYDHEAAFSVALSTGLVAVCLARRLRPLIRFGFMGLILAGILLAGYRTAIFAMGPLALAAFWAAFTQYVKPEHRRAVAAVALVLGLAGVAVVAVAYRARFADLGTFLADPASLIKPPRDFTQVERQIMSGRPLIWSEYLYAWAAGTPVQHLFGFGPESWTRAFDVYSHNTLISTLYELGLLGVMAMLLLWGAMAAMALRARAGERLTLAAAHLSFIILNFATMPFWQVEGLGLYGILCGYTLFSARAAAGRRAGARFSPPVPARGQRPAPALRPGGSPHSAPSIAARRR